MQLRAQLPFEQLAVPFIELHSLPQPPQFDRSRLRSASQPSSIAPGCGPLQSVNPVLQLGVQRPFKHVRESTLNVEQTPPHEPQLLMSFVTLSSQPVEISPSQSPNPLLQVMEQLPLLHIAVPFCDGQTLLQALQFTGSVFKFVSQPVVGTVSQSAKPALQLKPQVELVHVRVAF